MSLSTELKDEMLGLLARAREDSASAADIQRLRSLVVQNRDARQFYIRHFHLAASLRWALNNQGEPTAAPRLPAQDFDPQAPISPPSQPIGLSFLGNTPTDLASWLTMPKILAGLVSVGLITYFVLLFLSVGMQQAWHADGPPEVTPVPVARVTSLIECRWADDARSLNVGSALPGEPLRLLSGIVELESAQGVAIRLEGPAQFDLRSPAVGVLDAGSVSVRVPTRAVGFSIQTPTAMVVDLGTEFGVAVVEEDGTTDVQVITGQVEMQPKGGTKETRSAQAVRVAAGEARRIRVEESTGKPVIEPIRFDASRYVGPTLRDSPTEPSLDGRHAWDALVRNNTALAAYYPLNEPTGSKTAVDATGRGHDGSYRHGTARGGVSLGIAGPPVSEFPAFDSTNTAARFNCQPVDDQQLTPAVTDYLEVEEIANLNLTSYSFEVWFEYTDKGALQYIGGRGAGGQFEAVGLHGGTLLFAGAGIAALMNDADDVVQLGVWHHLLYARDGASVRVYLDGELKLNGNTVESAYGSSNRIVAGIRPDNVLPFAGALDELAIYNRALTGLEVRRHYEFGRRQP